MRARLLLLATLACASCDGSGGGGDRVSFDALVSGLIQDRTNETDEPAPIEPAALVLPGNDDAFDDLLPPDDGAVVGR
jgi:hypothetical protein